MNFQFAQKNERLASILGSDTTVCVSARIGDPIYAIGRARSIWAAQTAQASHDLGYPTTLIGSARSTAFKVDGPGGTRSLRRTISGLYNVDATFRTSLLYPRAENEREFGQDEFGYDLPRYVLPHCGLMHTRDPRVAWKCHAEKIPFIYEDHNEDYHLAASVEEGRLNTSTCKAVIAITDAVKNRLVFSGVRRDKIIVQDSGVNSRAFRDPNEVHSRWRKFFLQDRYEALLTYTGGMQEERGIADLLAAARDNPQSAFVLVGGNPKDCDYWLAEAKRSELHNVFILGYMPQATVCEIQQSSDVVLLTRAPTHRAAITSPLKFFEYLASGTPIVSARIPALDEREQQDLDVVWYDSAMSAGLTDAISAALERYRYSRSGSEKNQEVARHFTWQKRQDRIIEFAAENL